MNGGIRKLLGTSCMLLLLLLLFDTLRNTAEYRDNRRIPGVIALDFVLSLTACK